MKQQSGTSDNTVAIPVACCFVFNEASEILLLRRHTRDPGGNQWGPAGGRIDDGEDAKTTALRELQEETGIQAADIELLGVHEVHMPHAIVHMTTYKTTVPNDTHIIINPDEHHEYCWFSLDNLLETPDILWGVPTTLRDFGMLGDFGADPTLTDGSKVILLELPRK